jgi:phenylacetate-coenzyme A ligase PaaK-like adenylate-forming protein
MTGPMSITGNFASGSKLLAPVLVQPSNGATGQPTSVTLTWQDKNSSPQELHYKVRIKPAGGAYKNYTLAANTTSYITATILASKTYYWNVQALGNGTTIKTSAWANGGVDFKFKTK